MKILMLYVPIESRVRDFVRLVHLLKEAGYRIVAAEFDSCVASVKFERVGVPSNG